jgi:hypothetical protein
MLSSSSRAPNGKKTFRTGANLLQANHALVRASSKGHQMKPDEQQARGTDQVAGQEHSPRS